ncbi:TRAP transporter small permease [Sneathiella litorea]|uniref:TRAP transporter small permease protein n=1 Tax=Sneathiella litorea TaxID=2606216 RepID=A0A6L8W7Y0_9PROT|nr:TRAP transporter small permease [Sneathiella litorea]MZR30643.1 TRAP transporter small permease subunit [Sneathiella litorea]
MRNRWKTIWRWLDANVEYLVNSMFYAYLAGIVVVEVFRRYVLSSSSSWGEETAIYAFIWMTYFGAARGVRSRSHLAIDILRRRFSRTGKFVLNMLSDACFLILAAVIVVTSIKAVQGVMQYGQTFQGADIPMWLAMIGVPISWSLIIVRIVQRTTHSINLYRRGEIEANGPVLSE